MRLQGFVYIISSLFLATEQQSHDKSGGLISSYLICQRKPYFSHDLCEHGCCKYGLSCILNSIKKQCSRLLVVSLLSASTQLKNLVFTFWIEIQPIYCISGRLRLDGENRIETLIRSLQVSQLMALFTLPYSRHAYSILSSS